MTQSADWRNGFLFLGNNVVLDFLNTCPRQDGKSLELLPDFGSLLRWFEAAGLITSLDRAGLDRRWRGSSKAQQAYAQSLVLRETLRKEVLRWEAGKPVRSAVIQQLNRLMLEHPMLARLSTTSAPPAMERYFKVNEPSDLLAPLVHGAALLFAKVDRSKVRMCRHCILHFHDTSKKGARQWCSMQLCGNRAKVAAYAARKRTELS